MNAIIEAEDEDNFDFRLDFLMLFILTMVHCLSHGKCKNEILNSFTGETDFSKVDWCAYVLDSLKNCKKGWSSDVSRLFTGPLAILMVCKIVSFI